MARAGTVLPFHGVSAIATRETTPAQTESASVSQVALGSTPLSAGSGKEGDEADSLLRFFDLKRNPFSGTPEEGFIFYSNAAVRQVYRELITALGEHSGIAVLTGEAGIGKTTLLRRLRDELRAAGHLVIARYDAGLFFNDLVTVIAEEIPVPSGSADEVGFPSRLREQLERNKGARPPVLIIDDAERLGGNVIMNLGELLTGPADLSLRVLLCGRPELAKRLELPVLLELRRMLSVSCHLERLDDDDAASYIFHRLRAAGRRGSELFSSAAVNTVVAKAGGLPRQIDRLCAKSLTVAAATGKPVVTSEMVEEAAGDLRPKDASRVEARHGPAPIPRGRSAIAAGAGIIAVGIMIYSLGGREPASRVGRMASIVAEAGGPRRGISVTDQGVSMSPEGDAVPHENARPIRGRLQESPQLEQALQWASYEPGATPGKSSGHALDVTGAEPTAAAEQRSRVATAALRAQKEHEAGRITDPAGSTPAAPSEPVLSSPATAGTGASIDVELSATSDASTMENAEQPKSEQALSAKPAVGGEPSSYASLHPDDGISELSGTAAPGEVQTLDMSGPAGSMSAASNEGSAARAVTGPGEQTPAEDLGKSESPTPPATSPQSPAALTGVPAVTLPAVSPTPAGSIAALIERGNELFRIGDISAARLAYERAASGGSAAAMTALGMTHDPSVLSRATTGGIRPDPAIAAEWYRKAAALGDAEAVARIQHLPASAQ